MAPGREVGVDSQLGRALAQVLEPADLGGRERLVREVGERVAAEQRERLARRPVGLTRRGRPPGLGDEPLKAVHVDELGIDPQLIAAPAREDLRAPLLRHHPAQTPDVVLDHLGRARRRLLAPQTLDQPVGRDGAIRLQPEHRENRALLGPAKGDRAVVDDGLEMSEHADLHAAALVVGVARDQPNHLPRMGSTAGLRPV
jgi:hypothetical protein